MAGGDRSTLIFMDSSLTAEHWHRALRDSREPAPHSRSRCSAGHLAGGSRFNSISAGEKSQCSHDLKTETLLPVSSCFCLT